jgi:hypothetical protein
MKNLNIPVVPDEINFMSSMASFNAIDTNGIAICRVACLTSIKVVHWKRCVTGDLVQTLTVGNCLLNSILIAKNLVI